LLSANEEKKKKITWIVIVSSVIESWNLGVLESFGLFFCGLMSIAEHCIAWHGMMAIA